MISPGSFVSQDQSAGMMYPLTSMEGLPCSGEMTNCERCGALLNNTQEAIMSHLQRCCPEEHLAACSSKKVVLAVLISYYTSLSQDMLCLSLHGLKHFLCFTNRKNT